jgi:two-component system sensor histidine kinase KdpD
MLEEAQALKLDAVDVVIGYFEPHGRKDTIAKTEGLETVPRTRIEYRGTIFEEMDTDAIVVRRPQVCVVDEFPHTNVPGSDRAKRWELARPGVAYHGYSGAGDDSRLGRSTGR